MYIYIYIYIQFKYNDRPTQSVETSSPVQALSARNTMDHLAWTVGTGIPYARGTSVSHSGYLAHRNSKSETRGKE